MNQIREARHRRIARAVGVCGALLFVGWQLFLSTLHVDAPLRASMDDWFWIMAVTAILMFTYPSFLAGLIDGVPQDAANFQNNKPDARRSWALIAFGALLCSASVAGDLLFDRDAAQHGGLAGLMCSVALPMSGAVLIGWGWSRPGWMSLEDESHISRDTTVPTTPS